MLPTAGRIVVETDLVRAVIDTYGGDLRQLELLAYPVTVDQPDESFRLLNDKGADLFLIQSGLLGAEREMPNHHTPFSTERHNVRLALGEDSASVVLRWSSADGVNYRKVYTFYRNSYYVDVSFEVDNQSSSDWTGLTSTSRSCAPRWSKILEALASLVACPVTQVALFFTPEDKYQKIDFEEMYDANLARQTPYGLGSDVATLLR